MLSSVLNQAACWGWVGENVADRATPPPVRRARLDPPDPEIVIALIEAVKRSRYPGLGLFVHVAAVTGARRGELIALRWWSIDLLASHREAVTRRARMAGTKVGDASYVLSDG